jgi:predicted dehydrogenase
VTGLPRVAVVGVGHMGRFHAAKLKQLAAEGELSFAGVCDVDAERARAVASELGTQVLSDLDAVVGAASAACVAVPGVEHARVAGRLLDAGLDVLVEKPIASTREEALALIRAARDRGRVLQVGHVERFSAAMQRVLPVLQRPRFIEAHRIGPYKGGRATDVSVVLDLMIHDLDLISLLAGSEVERVEAIGVPVLSITEDIANARIRFANGCVANVTASRVSPEPLRKIRVFQSDAYLSIDLSASQIQIARREGKPLSGSGALPKIHAESLRFDPSDALLAQDRAFARTLRERGAPQVSGEDGYRALDLALRIQESLPAAEELGA